ncbi:MAG: YdeI/OmpD-associated family protein [Bacteroidota bacterium]
MQIEDFEAILEYADAALGWGNFITIPSEVAAQLIDGKDKRVVCTINGQERYQCALLSKGNGDYMVLVNNTRRKAMHLQVGSTVLVALEKDKSKYGMPMPEEFEELLKQDDILEQQFHALTKGRQRSLLHLIGKPKGTAKRLEKAIVVAEYLSANNGMLDFKALNEAFKNYKPDF